MAHHPLSYEQMRDRLTALMPLEFASMLAGLDRAIAEGAEDRVTDTVQRLTGRPARSFRALLERQSTTRSDAVVTRPRSAGSRQPSVVPPP